MFVCQSHVLFLANSLNWWKQCVTAAHQSDYRQKLPPRKHVWGYFACDTCRQGSLQITEPSSTPYSFEFEGISLRALLHLAFLSSVVVRYYWEKVQRLVPWWRERNLASWSNSATLQIRQRGLLFFSMIAESSCHSGSLVFVFELAFFVDCRRNDSHGTWHDTSFSF